MDTKDYQKKYHKNMRKNVQFEHIINFHTVGMDLWAPFS